jgi:hypothetical protein
MADSTHPDVGTFPTALAESLAFFQGVASKSALASLSLPPPTPC